MKLLLTMMVLVVLYVIAVTITTANVHTPNNIFLFGSIFGIVQSAIVGLIDPFNLS